MNGADRLCETLLANGVNVCFANPGTSEMHFVAALDRNPKMRCILGLFEGVVTGAADGYGRMTGRPAATLLHTGPGLANGLANLHNARRARTPLVNIVGDHASYHLRYDAPLTSDVYALAAPMSNWVQRVKGPDDVGATIEAAYIASLALPGVTTTILPADAAWGDAAPAAARAASPPKRPQASDAAIQHAAEIIMEAQGRVGLLLGGEALRGEALERAGEIAEATGARLFSPVLIARMERGRGRTPVARIPYAIGPALEALRDLDALILVGESEPVAFFAYPGLPSRLLPERAKVLALAGPGDDLPHALGALSDALGAATRKLKAAFVAPEAAPSGPLTEDAISIMLANALPENAILCDEGLTSARRFYALSEHAAPHDYLMNTGGSIGIGIPMAAGAAIACPDRKVITLQADGSGLYTVQGLWTQARENLDVLTIVFANHAYAILQIEMRSLGVNRFGRNAERMMSLDGPKIDWVGMAKSMGVDAARATTCEEFAALLAHGLKTKGPYLIEAAI
jgi:acetolactate synthase-1/2/3 large subunit